MEVVSSGRAKPWMKKILTLSASQASKIETSADVITEQITGTHRLIPLAPFGQTIFTGIHINNTPIAYMPVNDLAGDVLANQFNQAVAEATYSPSKPDAMTVTQAASSTQVNYPGGYGYSYGGGYGYGGGGYRGDWGYGYGH
jgi:hypothetical protein